MLYDKMSWLNELRKNKDYLIDVSSTKVSWVGHNGTVFESEYDECKKKEKEYGIAYMEWCNLLVRKNGSFELINLSQDDSETQDILDVLTKEMQENNWTNLKIIKSKGDWLIGLKNDGTVISIKRWRKKKAPIILEELKKWDSVTDITCCSKLYPTGDVKANYVFGLRTNGTVDFATDNNYKEFGQSVKSWNNIVSITSYPSREALVGIKKDGTVVAIGQNEYEQCDLKLWKDIVDALILCDCLIGVKRDGTLVKAGKIRISMWDELRQWENIAIIGSFRYCYHDIALGIQFVPSVYGITNEGKLLMLRPFRNPKIETNHGFSKKDKIGNYLIDKFIRTKILKEEEFFYVTVDTNIYVL